MYLLTKFCNCLREEKGRNFFSFNFDLTLILHILTKSNFLTSCSREKVELRKKIYRQWVSSHLAKILNFLWVTDFS